MTVLNADGTIRYASPSARRLLGYPTGDLSGKNLAGLVHPDDSGKFGRLLEEVLRTPGKAATGEFRVQHGLGSWLWLETLGQNLRTSPSIGGIMLSCRDITERRLLEEQLAGQALHDALTGLPNKALLIDRLEHALARAGRDPHPRLVALMALDLDNLNGINDNLGHSAGDRLISQVADRIKAGIRQGD